MEKYIVAIEIGSSKIRGALGRYDETGVLNVIAVQEEQVQDSVRYGQVRNVEEVANVIDEICRKLENSKAIAGRYIERVYVGLSGRSIGVEKAESTITFAGEDAIGAQIVEELKERIKMERQSEKDIYQIVPVSYYVDNELTIKPVGRVGKSIKGVFSVVDGNVGIKSNINRAVVERLGFVVSDYVVTMLAQADAVLSPEDKQLGCALVDFGAETTTVAIYRESALQSMVTLPMGSRNITRDLVSLNFIEEQAETIKRSVGVVNVSDETPQYTNPHVLERPEIANYIQSRASEIVANVMAQIEFANFKPSDLPSGLFLVGGGARLKGLSELFAEQKMRVSVGTIRGNVRLSDASITAGEAVDVISLLLWAMKDDAALDSLSPIEEYVDYTPNEPSTEGSDEGVSRIGTLDTDDEIEENEKVNKPQTTNNGNSGNGGNGDKVRKEGAGRKIITHIEKIRKGLEKILVDNLEDKFDDEEKKD